MVTHNGDNKPSTGVNAKSNPPQDPSPAKGAGMAGLPPTPPPNNNSNNSGSDNGNADSFTVVGQPSLDEKTANGSSRGRKATRKNKRQPVIPGNDTGDLGRIR